jgi:hypothetical protein
MIRAIMRAKRKLRMFLQKAKPFPKHLASRGKVTIPTITSVVTKAAMALMLAPSLSRDPARGKAMKAWMRTIEPTTAARATPMKPASRPIVREITSVGRRARRKPIVQMISKVGKAIERKNLSDTRREFTVFPLFLKKEKAKASAAAAQMNQTNMGLGPYLNG